MRASAMIGLLLFLCLAGLPARAAEEVEDTLGEHVVESGENLWSITARYLGDETLWRENWRLNPDIEDPNKLRIGQVLTVIVERRITARSAEVVAAENAVEKNLQRTRWQSADRGDDLAARDGLRTLADSSAVLGFNDNTKLTLTEYSQIFLEERQMSLRNVDEGRIEVVQGSAELTFEPVTRGKTAIEIVAGPSVTRPEPTQDGRGRLKTAAAAEGGARVMVYSGFGSVDAGGASVRVGAGLGTAVPESGPPSAPEKLLGSPRGLTPGDGSRWRLANTPLNWSPLDGAASYIVEICRDADCDRLVQRGVGIRETRWQPRLDESGAFHWRVTAVSASGLEGYPSRAVAFELPSVLVDEIGPRVAIVPRGYYGQDGDRLLVGPQTRLDLDAQDDAAGVASVEFRWGDGEWTTWTDEALTLPSPLPASFEARAVDRIGRVGPVARVELRLPR